MSHIFSLTPLHKAVIDDNLKEIQFLKGKYQECCDDLGFTPRELAQLLNRPQCLELLYPQKPISFLVQLKDSSTLNTMNVAEFENRFNIEYAPFLTFESYALLREVIDQCPYILRNSWIAADNFTYTKQFRKQLDETVLAKVSIRWVSDDVGYGLFAEQNMVKGDFIGEYTGELRMLSRWRSDQNGYCLHYHTKWWSLNYYVIDAMLLGNLMRFINHSDFPNIQPLCAVDRGLQRQIFIARNPILKGTQLTINYGADYWTKRQKITMP
ncbi:MAG: SET domain-containing protein-lysine N-methyltransferase [Parachlamydiaceae bacterium]|nr:SET domain-containing protein-lysine N-methyltransferase [Parachlamydiaceae bacterium]